METDLGRRRFFLFGSLWHTGQVRDERCGESGVWKPEIRDHDDRNSRPLATLFISWRPVLRLLFFPLFLPPLLPFLSTVSCDMVQAGFQFTVFLPQPPECCDSRHRLPCLALEAIAFTGLPSYLLILSLYPSAEQSAPRWLLGSGEEVCTTGICAFKVRSNISSNAVIASIIVVKLWELPFGLVLVETAITKYLQYVYISQIWTLEEWD